MKVLKLLKRVRLGDAKVLTKSSIGPLVEVAGLTQPFSMN